MDSDTRQPWYLRFVPVLALTAVCWVVLAFDTLFCHGRLMQHGIVPRHPGSLAGIFWAPFLHASFRHLAANTLPLLILGGVICGRSRSEFALVTVAGIVLGGGLTWLTARMACHVGASGLIFCYFGYLVSMAWFRRTFGTLCLSVVCLLLYGGILRGLFPTASQVSWESHLAGLLAGVLLAAVMARLRKDPKPQPAAPSPTALKL
ncbi:MAG TPA: rhomboid family intramembrane serine protease [Candidatus Acidoferrum sp.]|nr:rhomboid family intramembrane serine protease [Candidatus Acidoferrum sp.]